MDVDARLKNREKRGRFVSATAAAMTNCGLTGGQLPGDSVLIEIYFRG